MKRDPCCAKCKTPSGVCATKRTCPHHLAYARERDDDAGPDYNDPTGDKATYLADNEPRRWSG